MPLGHSSRAISSPIGTAGAAAPYGMATAGAASRRVQGSKFVPLSVFFLQLDAEGESEDVEGKQVRGYAEKGSVKKDEKLGPMHFTGVEYNSTRPNKRALGKGKKRKPLNLGGGDGEEMGESRGGTVHFEGAASKPQNCYYCKAAATKSLIWANGRAYIPCCEEHEAKGRSDIVEKNEDEIAYVRKIDEDTTTANVAAYPVPIGKPVRRIAAPVQDKGKKRKQWMERLAKAMDA